MCGQCGSVARSSVVGKPVLALAAKPRKGTLSNLHTYTDRNLRKRIACEMQQACPHAIPYDSEAMGMARNSVLV
eukprot:543684-Amphidinium_carterae.1